MQVLGRRADRAAGSLVKSGYALPLKVLVVRRAINACRCRVAHVASRGVLATAVCARCGCKRSLGTCAFSRSTCFTRQLAMASNHRINSSEPAGGCPGATGKKSAFRFAAIRLANSPIARSAPIRSVALIATRASAGKRGDTLGIPRLILPPGGARASGGEPAQPCLRFSAR
jgi:hypothetical protein